jgi:hypothetical protein
LFPIGKGKKKSDLTQLLTLKQLAACDIPEEHKLFGVPVYAKSRVKRAKPSAQSRLDR